MADRLDRLRLAKFTQLLVVVQTACLAAITLGGFLTIWLLLALTIIQGVIFSFWQPVRLALVTSLVSTAVLSSAIAINSIIFNSARFIGPALAGLVLVASSPGWAFLVNALTSLIFLYALLFIKLSAPPTTQRSVRKSVFSDIGDGYRYAHDEVDGFAAGARYLPDSVPDARFYEPVDRGLEIKISQRLNELRTRNDDAKKSAAGNAPSNSTDTPRS